MRAYVSGIPSLAVLLASLIWALPAWADILPPPQRPADWDEHPAPMPTPPPEKEDLAMRILAGTALALASAAVLRRRCVGLAAPVEHAR